MYEYIYVRNDAIKPLERGVLVVFWWSIIVITYILTTITITGGVNMNKKNEIISMFISFILTCVSNIATGVFLLET